MCYNTLVKIMPMENEFSNITKTAIILAAGEGKRMKSSWPKVVHRVSGWPMLAHVLKACASADIDKTILVLGHGVQAVSRAIDLKGIHVVIQEEQLGTAHAVKTAMPEIEGDQGVVVVLCGDMPLIREESLGALLAKHEHDGLAATILTAMLDEPSGYGRIIRDEDNEVIGIVEERDADGAKRAVKEVNTGAYCFDFNALTQALEMVSPDNDQKEHYLTDAIGILHRDGKKVGAQICIDPNEAIGINSRKQLAEANRIMQTRINDRLMDEGVTIVDPMTTYIDRGVAIGPDTVIMPGTHIEGETTIGAECTIGPSVRIIDSDIADHVTIGYSVVRGVKIASDVAIGPFCSLRPGTVMDSGSKAGSFVEIKKSFVGRGSKVPHLSYIGDATLGIDVNIGAGSITCNYDGFNKHATEIGDGVFLGSDTMLVAPVKIGKGAITGAGSVISKDVPDDALGVERSEQRNVAGYASERRTNKIDKTKNEGVDDV